MIYRWEVQGQPIPPSADNKINLNWYIFCYPNEKAGKITAIGNKIQRRPALYENTSYGTKRDYEI